MITLIDYGLGNIQAFANIYKRMGIQFSIASEACQLKTAKHLILPGVGAFDWAMDRLNASGMRSTLDHLVLSHKVPILGICVGMQMMAYSSEEGSSEGLGWIPGSVRRFNSSKLPTRAALPHMGWNTVQPVALQHSLFSGISGHRFYFLHSYFFSPESTGLILAETDYGDFFPSAVFSQNIFGLQFHPEKSHCSGVQLLKNFTAI